MEVGSIRIPLGVDKTKAHVENILQWTHSKKTFEY